MNSIRMKNANEYLHRFYNILEQMKCKMLSFEPTVNITLYFIECMIPHHQAAIYMSENLLKYTTYQPLIDIANDIIRMQKRGIEQMIEIAKTTKGYCNSQNSIKMYLSKYLCITKNMVNRMETAPSGMNINLNFVNEMIPHHEGAIQMCNNLLQYDIDPRLAQVAKNIIKEQSNGVEELKYIRCKLCK